MEARLLLGQAGIPIRAFGMTVPHFSSELGSASGSLGDTGGAGTTGDAIGTTIMRSTTTSDFTRKAGRFITATDSIEANAPAVITTVPKKHHSPLGATAGPPAAMPSLAPRTAFTPAPSAVTTTAERQGAIHHAEVPASAAEEGRVAALADIDNRSFVRFLVLREI